MQGFLYELSERFSNLVEVESEDVSITEVIQEMYKGEVVPAVSDGIRYIREQAEQIASIDNEIKRLQDLKKSRENRLERVKAGYTEFIKAVGKKKVETDRGNMTVTTTAGRLIVDDIAKLPPEYTTSTVTVSPNKTAIKEAIKAGTKVDGAHIETKDTIRIK